MHNFSPIRVGPGNAAWANIRSEFDETFTSKSVEVEPQAVLQTDSHSRSRHPISVPFVSENTCWNYFAAIGGVSGRSLCLLGGMGRAVLDMPGQELGEIRRRKRLLKLTPAAEEQTMPVGCLHLPGISNPRT